MHEGTEPTPAEETRTATKRLAARNLLGTAMNVTSQSEVYQQISEGTEPVDFPEVLNVVARKVLWRDDWDADLPRLHRQLTSEGYAGRIQHGVLLSDLYWDHLTPSWREDLEVLRQARDEERAISEASATLARLQ